MLFFKLVTVQREMELPERALKAIVGRMKEEGVGSDRMFATIFRSAANDEEELNYPPLWC